MIVGIAVSISERKVYPRVSRIAGISLSMLLVLRLAIPIWFEWTISSSSLGRLAMFGRINDFLNALAYLGIIAAIFSWRNGDSERGQQDGYVPNRIDTV
jgi:hypothetical protein